MIKLVLMFLSLLHEFNTSSMDYNCAESYKRRICSLCHQDGAQLFWRQQGVHEKCADLIAEPTQPIVAIIRKYFRRDKKANKLFEIFVDGMNVTAQNIHGGFISVVDFYRRCGKKQFTKICQTVAIVYLLQSMAYKVGKLKERKHRLIGKPEEKIKLKSKQERLSKMIKDLHALFITQSAAIIGYSAYACYKID